MKTILLATALLVGGASTSAFAATPAAPTKHKVVHAATKPGSPTVSPARDPSTDKLNQQQLDQLKSS